MFGKPDGKAVLKNVIKAMEFLDQPYEIKEENMVVLTAMGDDLPIGMLVTADETNLTLNIYCFLMFDIPDDAKNKLILELNRINNTINNGAFYMDTEENRIYFKIVQSFYDRAPSSETIAHLMQIAFKTVDVNDGNLKGLIPADALRKDCMYS